MRLQRWVCDNILRHIRPHPASFAYHPQSQPVFASRVHRGSNWLVKVDITDFFDSITEAAVFDVFVSCGYGKLLSFELARICTRGQSLPIKTITPHVISAYDSVTVGFLPQGAPTSPMLSNLVMRKADAEIANLAKRHSFRYTRYADDIALSTSGDGSYSQSHALKRGVVSILRQTGFAHNRRKTSVRGPGARRTVLGALVDSDQIHLQKEFKANLDLHLYFLSSPRHGPATHAKKRKTTVSNMFHHVRGLIAWAERVEPDYGKSCLAVFEAIAWPPISGTIGYHP